MTFVESSSFSSQWHFLSLGLGLMWWQQLMNLIQCTKIALLASVLNQPIHHIRKKKMVTPKSWLLMFVISDVWVDSYVVEISKSVLFFFLMVTYVTTWKDDANHTLSNNTDVHSRELRSAAMDIKLLTQVKHQRDTVKVKSTCPSADPPWSLVGGIYDSLSCWVGVHHTIMLLLSQKKA